MVRLLPERQQVLACQYRVMSDLHVEVPAESRFFEHRILTEGSDAPCVAEPTLALKYPDDRRRSGLYGVAVDIGTTTVVVRLVDLVTGRSLAVNATVNPQTRFGDDVISRITYGQTQAGLRELRESVIACINDLIAKCAVEAGINPADIMELCAVANTTMNHILLGLPVEQLGRAPYAAHSVEAFDVSAGQMGLSVNPQANLRTIENIAGFVGSDTVAVALATDVASAREMTLIVDIGTNGEVVLGTQEKLLAASCAAGPALEGARIACGGRAATGAIEAVVISEDDVAVDVIGGTMPQSICGSGLIDAVAVLLDLGIIDNTGRFVDSEVLNSVPPAIAERICEKDGGPAFILARADGQHVRDVFLTQRDIREVQLAKGAIRAGIKLLQNRLDLGDSDIEKVLLAGAFGNYIRRRSALRIGLLPNVPPERIHFVGNAAGVGAHMALISTEAREQCGRIARRIEYVEIAHDPDFQMAFAEAMLF